MQRPRPSDRYQDSFSHRHSSFVKASAPSGARTLPEPPLRATNDIAELNLTCLTPPIAQPSGKNADGRVQSPEEESADKPSPRRRFREYGPNGRTDLFSAKTVQDRQLLMARAQVCRQQVQIPLGRCDLRMPEHHRQAHDVATVAQVVGRKGMAQAVPAELGQTELSLHQIKRSGAVAFRSEERRVGKESRCRWST